MPLAFSVVPLALLITTTPTAFGTTFLILPLRLCLIPISSPRCPGHPVTMHSWAAFVDSSASRTEFVNSSPLAVFPGHPATVHSWIDFANSSPRPGHPDMMHSRLGFPSLPRSGHPDMMHSRTGFNVTLPSHISSRYKQPLKSCLKQSRSDSDLSADSSSTQRKKKTVHFPSDDSLKQVRKFRTAPASGLKNLCRPGLERLCLVNPMSKVEAVIYAPSCSLEGRFVKKFSGPSSHLRYESRKSTSWPSVVRARRYPVCLPLKSEPVLMSEPVDVVPQPVLAASKPQDMSAPMSQVSVVCLPPESPPRQIIGERKVQPYVKVSMSWPTLFRYLLAMVLLLGFCYPDIWTVLLLMFFGYLTIRM
jgi:hypothetical protein